MTRPPACKSGKSGKSGESWPAKGSAREKGKVCESSCIMGFAPRRAKGYVKASLARLRA